MAFSGGGAACPSGIFASLNCGPGSGDDRAARDRKPPPRRRGAGAGRGLVTVHQIHSGTAVTVDAPWALGQGPQADAMATDRPGIALGILTADCAPVLFADPEARVIGAAHAGWKGALGGVVEAVLAAMEGLGAARGRIPAAIGPCISQANYEVGAEFRARFCAAAAKNAQYFIASDRPAHFRFDLEGYAAARLAASGVADVGRLSACTYAREADFFSFRRTTHRSERDYGRQISAIALAEPRPTGKSVSAATWPPASGLPLRRPLARTRASVTEPSNSPQATCGG